MCDLMQIETRSQRSGESGKIWDDSALPLPKYGDIVLLRETGENNFIHRGLIESGLTPPAPVKAGNPEA